MIPSQQLRDVRLLVSFPLDLEADPPVAVDELGVKSKHRASNFVTKLWLSD